MTERELMLEIQRLSSKHRSTSREQPSRRTTSRDKSTGHSKKSQRKVSDSDDEETQPKQLEDPWLGDRSTQKVTELFIYLHIM
jgi:hypothetical protein